MISKIKVKSGGGAVMRAGAVIRSNTVIFKKSPLFHLNCCQYMIILFMVFLIQFAVACACLAFNSEQQVTLAKSAWQKADSMTNLKDTVQKTLQCCGFDKEHQGANQTIDGMGHPPCGPVGAV